MKRARVLAWLMIAVALGVGFVVGCASARAFDPKCCLDSRCRFGHCLAGPVDGGE